MSVLETFHVLSVSVIIWGRERIYKQKVGSTYTAKVTKFVSKSRGISSNVGMYLSISQNENTSV